MSTQEKALSQLICIVATLEPSQRQVLAAMAGGAQVLQVEPTADYSAWLERPSDGKVVQACENIKPNDFRSMRLLLPMVSKAFNKAWGNDFFYLPASSRDSVRDALTMTQPIPDLLKARLEQEIREAEASASLDASSDEPVARERMAA